MIKPGHVLKMLSVKYVSQFVGNLAWMRCVSRAWYSGLRWTNMGQIYRIILDIGIQISMKWGVQLTEMIFQTWLVLYSR